MFKTSRKLKTLAALFISLCFSSVSAINVNATGGAFTLTPMYQQVILTPGETFEGNFEITNPANSTADFEYELRVEPFSVDEENGISLTVNGDYNQMVDWITLPFAEGSVPPNMTEKIRFQIDVPADAAAGGQYASVVVSSKPKSASNASVDIQEVYQSAHLIYAEVAGETVRKGTINSVSVPSFLLSGNITSSASITNTGNVHSRADYVMQIFPLFSNEEVYTNEENPAHSWIMPGNTNLKELSWEETPTLGVFHVIFKASFEGVESKVDKYVIVCPLWLLLVIFLAIFLIIFRVLSAKKKN